MTDVTGMRLLHDFDAWAVYVAEGHGALGNWVLITPTDRPLRSCPPID